MTDAFEVTGAFAPAETISTSPLALMAADSSVRRCGLVEESAAEVPATPNGFVVMGLAPELVHAVKDLGYTQPTSVQLKTIPLALPR
jgi:hypothetical protein